MSFSKKADQFSIGNVIYAIRKNVIAVGVRDNSVTIEVKSALPRLRRGQGDESASRKVRKNFFSKQKLRVTLCRTL